MSFELSSFRGAFSARDQSMAATPMNASSKDDPAYVGSIGKIYYFYVMIKFRLYVRSARASARLRGVRARYGAGLACLCMAPFDGRHASPVP
jgi:hypothetical protein